MQGRDIVVVHSSDIHVDHVYTAQIHGGDGAAGLACVLNAARQLGADVVLLAGDTFDCHRLPHELINRAAAIIAEAAVPIVLLPGNHDPIVPEAVYHHNSLAGVANLHIIGIAHAEAIVFPDLDLEVWGRAHCGYGDMIPFETVRPRRTRWQIATAHGHYVAAPNRSVSPRPSWLIGDDEISATAADYVALGHWNSPARVGNGSVAAYYSGSPEFAGSFNVVRLTGDGRVSVTRTPLDIARDPYAEDHAC
jgi:DNA repair exonuclease SbcCD nuclease subunit